MFESFALSSNAADFMVFWGTTVVCALGALILPLAG